MLSSCSKGEKIVIKFPDECKSVMKDGQTTTFSMSSYFPVEGIVKECKKNDSGEIKIVITNVKVGKTQLKPEAQVHIELEPGVQIHKVTCTEENPQKNAK